MISKILFRIGVVSLALFILFLSVARAGLELVAQEGGADLIKNTEVNFIVTSDDGETAPNTYKLPEVGTLPDNMLYGFKRIRDYFWLTFSNGISKLKLSVLLADKKIVEFAELTNKDKNNVAIEAGNEAIDKLEYADSLLSKTQLTDVEARPIRRQIYLAGYAYKELIKKTELKFGFESEKYTSLINRIDERNKEQEKNRYSWDY